MIRGYIPGHVRYSVCQMHACVLKARVLNSHRGGEVSVWGFAIIKCYDLITLPTGV